jgi:long-chain acyl-CoA synthetase
MAAEVLRRGRILIWFPEEWRSPTGELQHFLPGVGKLLKESGAPAVPAFIRGTFEAMPRNRRLPRPAPVSVVFGDPVPAPELETKGAGANAPERIANALHDAVADLPSQRTAGGAS